MKMIQRTVYSVCTCAYCKNRWSMCWSSATNFSKADHIIWSSNGTHLWSAWLRSEPWSYIFNMRFNAY